MGSVATILKQAGHDVRGSDEGTYPPMSEQLAMARIPVMEPFNPANLDWGPDLVVVGNVCRKDHVEVLEAQRRSLPLESMASVLEKYFLSSAEPIVVAGTHGKTTTTSLLAHLLTKADLAPSFLVGGVPLNFGRSSMLGTGRHFVIEGDEYDTAFFDKTPKFHHYRPKWAVITSVEFDHADIYPDFASVKRAFAHFAGQIPGDGLLVAHQDVPKEILEQADSSVWLYRVEESDPELAALSGRFTNPAETQGRYPVWTAVILSDPPVGFGSLFQIFNPSGEFVGTFRIGMQGRHNVANALAALLITYRLGLHRPAMSRGLSSFRGVRRRQEFRGLARGVTVIDDFAHHPTAVRETLRAFRAVKNPKAQLLAIFEPRSNTSRRNVFQGELADALSEADQVFIGPLRNVAGIPKAERLDTETLAADIRSQQVPAQAFDQLDALLDKVLTNVRAGDIVVVMSSGSFGNLPTRILMGLGDPITPAASEDLRMLQDLLAEHGLACGGRKTELSDYFVVRSPGRVIGCIGMESWGPYGLLKDMLVVSDRRGEGLGWMLAKTALDHALRLGLQRVFMFGTDATKKIGEVMGFQPWPQEPPEELADSRQFQRPQHAGAVLMSVEVTADERDHERPGK